MSMRVLASFFALALLVSLGRAADPVILYEIAQVDGVRVGSRVVTTVADGKNDKTTATLDLSLRRYGSLVRLRREESSVESSDHLVLGLSLRQGVPGGKQLVIVGRLDDEKMIVRVDERPAHLRQRNQRDGPGRRAAGRIEPLHRRGRSASEPR